MYHLVADLNPTSSNKTDSEILQTAKYPEQHGTDILAWLGDKSHVKMMDQCVDPDQLDS